MLIWYHGIAMGLFISYIPKSTNIHVWRHNDVIIADFAQIADLQWNRTYRPKMIFSPQKSSKYMCIGISPGFLLSKEGNVSNIYCKIQDHNMTVCFKILIPNIAELHPPPSRSDFDGLPYAR